MGRVNVPDDPAQQLRPEAAIHEEAEQVVAGRLRHGLTKGAANMHCAGSNAKPVEHAARAGNAAPQCLLAAKAPVHTTSYNDRAMRTTN